ncbi:hypothetical protein [Pseudomonas sp.]|uniref:hypothetical protein n=1 Tax=Pseudomonas sp. TaxID=306 RepID=UPI003BB7BFB0
MFYRFLSTEKKYKSIDIANYHTAVDNKDIRRWQVSRQVERINKKSSRPNSNTIFDDATIVLNFFAWVKASGFTTNVNITLKNWVANFRSETLLSYIRAQSTVKISGDPIRVLDREARQKKKPDLITNDEIKILLKSYPDPVYATLFRMGLATALRPLELCAFPYAGYGQNKHILPYSSMPDDQKQFSCTVVGKGGKIRTIKIPAYALRDLEESYTKTEYHLRKRKYKEKYKKTCPPSILFLNSEGDPITPKMISDCTTYACKRAHMNDPSFRLSNNFYQARHWWPTMMMIQHHGEALMSSAADVLDAAFAQVLMNQMGHNKLATTYKHYLDLARVLVMTRQGRINEVITEDFNIHSQIES